MRIKRYSSPPFMTNTYCLYDEESKQAVLIDPTGSAASIQPWLEEQGIRMLGAVFTHAHADHFPALKETWFQAFPWHAHPKALDMFQNPEMSFSNDVHRESIVYTHIRSIDLDQSLQIGPFAFRVLETPGHTPGSVCYLIGNVLFSGDTLFKESIGRTDFPTGSMEMMKASLKMLMAELPDEILVFPGHGDQTSIGHERRMNPYIEVES